MFWGLTPAGTEKTGGAAQVAPFFFSRMCYQYRMTCTQPNCTRKHHANGLCYAHYMREYKGYKASGPIREPRIPGVRPCGKTRCPAAQKLRAHLHYLANRDAYIARANDRPAEEKSRCKTKWKAENGAKVRAHTIARKRGLKAATPPWLTEEHWQKMNQKYAEARQATQMTGIEHHVDHIIPLKGKTVCGLHVPWNLRVITAEENMKRKRSI